MIDCHCHLEQPEFDQSRDEIIKELQSKLKAVITCCSHPRDFELSLKLTKSWPGFVFCSAAIHPEYIKELSPSEIESFIEKIKVNRDSIAAIGETGLDFYWIKETELREKQVWLFKKFIALARELDKPLVIHSRNASEEVINILEQEQMPNRAVLLHLFSERKLLKRVIENGWWISIGPGIARSKDIKKIARDMPLNKILLETDSPWFAQQGQAFGLPTNVFLVAEEIAKIKKLNIEEIERATDENAIKFFKLPLC
ncbi:MAG: TatD family hydrolase [Candidatus Pacearchaeota archaeon]